MGDTDRRAPLPDEPVSFFESEPPHWAARGLAWVIIAVFTAVVVASVVIRVPETVSSSLRLVPLGGADPIRAARGGVVTAVHVREGESLKRGETAFTVRSSAIGDRAGERTSLEAQLAGAEQSRANARERYESQRRGDDEEATRLTRRAAHVEQKLGEQGAIRTVRATRFRRDLEIQRNELDITQKEIEFRKTQHGMAQELADRLERHYRDGTISWLEYNNRRLEATRLAAELQQLDRALENGRLKLSQLQAEQDGWEIDWKLAVAELEQERRDVRGALEKLRVAARTRDAEYRETDRRLAEDAAQARIRIATLREDLAESRGSELSLGAPCDGSVLRVVVKAPGAVVQEGDVLGELACSGERLQAEVTVPPSGVGRIKPGQSVKLFYDAFPYQRYGVRYGTVRWVSPASITVKDEVVFRVLADIDAESVQVKGEARRLMAGMGGRANIVVGRRSLLSYAFEPIQQLRETLAERPRP
jgi:multidrug efflux pump subunit AcrA (membrane-fusion protein)